MSHWGPRSRVVYATLHPELQLLCDTVLQYHDCSLIWGSRDEEEQNDLYERKLTRLKYPFSRHNKVPSSAVDKVPYVRPYGAIMGNRPEDLKYFYRFAGVVLAIAYMLYMNREMKYRIRWGGDWDSDYDLDDQTFNDLYHYELILSNSG